MRDGKHRADSGRTRYLRAAPLSGGMPSTFLPRYFHRLIPAFLLLTITGVVLLGGGFWSAPRATDPATGLPTGLTERDIAMRGGVLVPDATTADETDSVSVTVAVPGGSTTTSLASSSGDSTFLGYLSRPGTNRTAIPQRVAIIPAFRGDTLETIAGRMHATPQALMWANGISDPAGVLPVGQTVRVPPPGTMLHRVKDTDTLDSIARAYQVKVPEITGYVGNNVQESADLVPGAFLLIPTTNLPVRDRTVFYQVQEGDSLARISAIYGLNSRMTLRWANNLPTDLIFPGQVIAIPPTDGVIHVVEPVDTQRTVDDAVTQIAKNFACAAIPCNDPPSDLRVNDLAGRVFAFGGNHLTHGGRLVPGQELVIPGGIPYVEPPPVIIPVNVALDNASSDTPRASAASPTVWTSPSSGGSAPAPVARASGGGNAAIVSVAQRYLGAYRQPSGLPWAFWCEKFVGDVADNAGVGHYRFGTALADAYAGPLNRGMAPAGTLVFFDSSWNVAGHVGIAMGDGTMISALVNGVVRTAYAGSSGYLGWRSF